ncbi:MAG: glycoside hydrolase family 25 protein [Oscillospiraceae bacterium]
MNGIDVSEWQGVIDWEKLRGKVDFAMLRAGYGQRTLDKQFERNVRECNRLGIPCGVYWFCYALTAGDARLEAQRCLEAIKPYRIEFPVCYDLEYDSIDRANAKGVIIGKELASAMVDAFLGEIEAAGYYAMNYGNQDFLSRIFSPSIPQRWDLWLAAWPINPDATGPAPRQCGIWQYGAELFDDLGLVDSDVSYKDYPKLIRAAGLNHLAPSPEPLPPIVSNLDTAVAEIVAAGGADVIMGIAEMLKN